MARKWVAGDQTLEDYQIPYQPGTDEYYQYVAQWKAKAKGQTYNKSQKLLDLEAKIAADKNALPEWQKEQDWQDAHKDTLRQYAEEMANYTQGQRQYDRDNTDLARQADKSGQAAAGYDYYDAQGNKQTPENGVYAAVSGGYYKASDPYFTGKGKMGGAGNENPNASVDNSWNDLDGQDIRTDEQKYYDRNIKDFNQIADNNGTYNWYGTEFGYDKNDKTKTRSLNLTGLADRTSNPDGVDAGKQAPNGFDGSKMYDYNGAQSQSWFEDQVRNRANKSNYARTA